MITDNATQFTMFEVPEPGTAVLLAGGLFCLFGRRRPI